MLNITKFTGIFETKMQQMLITVHGSTYEFQVLLQC